MNAKPVWVNQILQIMESLIQQTCTRWLQKKNVINKFDYDTITKPSLTKIPQFTHSTLISVWKWKSDLENSDDTASVKFIFSDLWLRIVWCKNEFSQQDSERKNRDRGSPLTFTYITNLINILWNDRSNSLS